MHRGEAQGVHLHYFGSERVVFCGRVVNRKSFTVAGVAVGDIVAVGVEFVRGGGGGRNEKKKKKKEKAKKARMETENRGKREKRHGSKEVGREQWGEGEGEAKGEGEGGIELSR